jgi:transposase
MIGLPENLPIYLCTQPVDIRKGFDGLTAIVTTTHGKSVNDGSLFLFVNRKRDRVNWR